MGNPKKEKIPPCELQAEELADVTGGSIPTGDYYVPCKAIQWATSFLKNDPVVEFCWNVCEYNGTPQCKDYHHIPTISDTDIIAKLEAYLNI